MNSGGLAMMVGSWVFIIALSAFCMRKVLRLTRRQAKHIKPIYEIDTKDLNED